MKQEAREGRYAKKRKNISSKSENPYQMITVQRMPG